LDQIWQKAIEDGIRGLLEGRRCFDGTEEVTREKVELFLEVCQVLKNVRRGRVLGNARGIEMTAKMFRLRRFRRRCRKKSEEHAAAMTT
jgi:hypothetical protein